MASGYGTSGGPSRCFPFWQKLLACYVVNSGEGENGKLKCVPVMEDYYECLHHKKEAARTRALQNAYRKALAAHPRENVPRAEQISSLGLLGKEEDTKLVLESR
ncbi:hypothetical protein D8B26_003348 [Coccidioides posadasii str. Silveira]|uniref:NADH dehydrogenase [ubiquinone] iron-sulfur protein 5 n=1 Tax=Coccidioides posadasii (strain RMSCC 757 / Silveira) TaxID=443226 RepID=E9CZX0_COCPS|nr:NADH:ubiquinone oxidoreductase 11.5kD subunit [Coccidioides posadasii str. Silveira]QVM08667.1 hypothetical protein D8B26_003348 [Coccidioides posadasii str. Silveira]